jgi:hypothetical protein
MFIAKIILSNLVSILLHKAGVGNSGILANNHEELILDKRIILQYSHREEPQERINSHRINNCYFSFTKALNKEYLLLLELFHC